MKREIETEVKRERDRAADWCRRKIVGSIYTPRKDPISLPLGLFLSYHMYAGSSNAESGSPDPPVTPP